jgi:large subunit ribosomal protein L29
MKPDKIREKTTEEIEQGLKESREKLFQLKFENNISKLKNSSVIRALRRDIARMLTIIKEKKMEKK